MITSLLKLSAAMSLLLVSLSLIAIVSIWGAVKLASGGPGSNLTCHTPVPLARRVRMDDLDTSTVTVSSVVVGLTKIDPWALMDMENIAPVEMDLSTGRLRLSNGRPIRDPDEVVWLESGRALWEKRREAAR